MLIFEKAGQEGNYPFCRHATLTKCFLRKRIEEDLHCLCQRCRRPS